MNIPDQAAQAIAKALFSRDSSQHGVLRTWDQIPEASRRHYITDAELLVENALPIIQAQAWNEGYEDGVIDGDPAIQSKIERGVATATPNPNEVSK